MQFFEIWQVNWSSDGGAVGTLKGCIYATTH
jgi:hypothetical protein